MVDCAAPCRAGRAGFFGPAGFVGVAAVGLASAGAVAAAGGGGGSSAGSTVSF